MVLGAYFAYPTFQSERATSDFPDRESTCVPVVPARIPVASNSREEGKRPRLPGNRWEEEDSKENLIIGNLLVVLGVGEISR